MSIPISQFIPPTARFPLLVSIRLFSTCVSISALQTGSTDAVILKAAGCGEKSND